MEVILCLSGAHERGLASVAQTAVGMGMVSEPLVTELDELSQGSA